MTDMYDEPKVSSVDLPAYQHSERGAPVSLRCNYQTCKFFLNESL